MTFVVSSCSQLGDIRYSNDASDLKFGLDVPMYRQDHSRRKRNVRCRRTISMSIQFVLFAQSVSNNRFQSLFVTLNIISPTDSAVKPHKFIGREDSVWQIPENYVSSETREVVLNTAMCPST
jgi:hypothetical protein